jgi:hypothetical protein
MLGGASTMTDSSDGLKESDDAPTPQRGPDGLYHDLDEFIGTWIDDPEFDEVVKWFDQIDDEMWSRDTRGESNVDA